MCQPVGFIVLSRATTELYHHGYIFAAGKLLLGSDHTRTFELPAFFKFICGLERTRAGHQPD